MRTRNTFSFLAAAAATLLLGIGQTKAALIESWENTLDGWTVPSPFGSNTSFTGGFDTVNGVTDGLYSLAVTGTAAPNYSQMLISSSSLTYTSLLANASALNFDVFTPPGSFGSFLQFDVDINNSATGFVSLDSFSYPATVIGAEHTFSLPITPAMNAALAGSGSGTTIIMQVGGGFTAGNETFYIDNVRTTELVPEPASIALMGLAIPALITVGRRRFGRRG